jgi:hypothetical protein
MIYDAIKEAFAKASFLFELEKMILNFKKT